MNPCPADLQRLRSLLREGTCCSVAMVRMALERRGEQNDQLLQAMSGLCGGVQGGLACGALTGAACMLNLLDPERANTVMVPELVEWFTETMDREHGGSNCRDIVHGDPLLKRSLCPGLVEAVYLKAKEILIAYGHDFD